MNRKKSYKISIITPSYNSGEYITRAIESVVAQDYTDWEHIVVDGGSNDNTIEILEQYPHIKWVSEPDQGQSDAMNKGFKLSTGDIIVYLNADDWFEPKAFSSVAEAFEKENKDIIFGDLRVINTQNQSEEVRTPSTDYQSILKYWNNEFPANPVSYFYKRKVQENYLFPINNHLSMDLDFLFYASKHFEISYLPAILGVFFLDGENKTSNINVKKVQRKAYLDHCQKYEPYLYLKFHLGEFKQKILGR